MRAAQTTATAATTTTVSTYSRHAAAAACCRIVVASQATATERTIDDRAKRSVAVQLARTVCARVRARRLSPIRTATRKSVTGTPIPFRLVSQRTKRPDTPSLDHRVNRIRRPAFATINLSARGRLQQCRRGGVFRMSV